MNKRRIFRVVQIVIMLYAIIGIALYYLQEKFLFHPEKLHEGYIFEFPTPHEESSLQISEVEKVSFVKFFTGNNRKGLIVYFHGNRGNINYYYPGIRQLIEKGYEVWMPDYPGFGKSTGDRSEEVMYHHAMQLYKLAASVISQDSITVYGRSLGSGIASYVAANHNPALLMLETPYNNIADLFLHYAPVYPAGRMARFKFPNDEHLPYVKCNTVIVHGRHDEVIPLKLSAKLQKHMKPADKFIIVEDGKHNNLVTTRRYMMLIDSLF